MITGYKYATGKYIVNMDDDFQNPASEIVKLISKLEDDNLDVVFAKYYSQKQSGFRLLGSRLNYKMTEYMMGKPKGIQTNAFFVMRKFVSDEIVKYNNNYPYVFGIIFAATSNIGNVEIEHRARLKGESGYTFASLVSLWMNGALSFSVKPLRMATWFGFAVSFIAFLGIIGAFISRILNPFAPLGWASTVIIILFFAGVQLASIGLLGEYIGRLYISNSNLPKAVVREMVNITKDEKGEDDVEIIHLEEKLITKRNKVQEEKS
jgi:undecaprenyl-phosphate 4-deoxy-4-formamido-L-arabinose transferase